MEVQIEPGSRLIEAGVTLVIRRLLTPRSWLGPLVVALSVALGGISAAGPEEAPQAGQMFRDCSDCPEMVVYPREVS